MLTITSQDFFKKAGLIFIFLAFLIPSRLSAQYYDDRVYTDKITYAFYLQQNWDYLLKESDEAIQNKVDFYELRLRRGIAYLNKGDYLSSIPEFEKAGKFLPNDTSSKFYLYYAYLYLGRDTEARQIAHKLPQVTKDYMGYRKSLITEAGIFGSASIFNADDTKSTMLNNANYGSWTGYTNLYGGGFFISHLLGSRISFAHNFSYFAFGNTQKVNFTNQKATFEHSGGQISAGTEMRLRVANRLTLKANVLYNYISTSIHDLNTTTQLYYPSTFDQDGLVLGGSLDYRLKKVVLFGGEYWNNFIDFFTLQTTAGLTYYPFGNARLSLRGAFTVLSNLVDVSPQAQDELLYRFKFATQLSKSIWLEGGYLNGNMQSYFDPEDNAVYYIFDRTKQQFQGNLFFIIGKNIRLYLKYTMTMRENDQYYATSSTPLPPFFLPPPPVFPTDATLIKPISYNSNQISSTLIWKF